MRFVLTSHASPNSSAATPQLLSSTPFSFRAYCLFSECEAPRLCKFKAVMLLYRLSCYGSRAACGDRLIERLLRVASILASEADSRTRVGIMFRSTPNMIHVSHDTNQTVVRGIEIQHACFPTEVGNPQELRDCQDRSIECRFGPKIECMTPTRQPDGLLSII